MLKIAHKVSIPDREVEIIPIRSQGPGGQNVNKVSTGIHLRFDIQASSLPLLYKQRLFALSDQRISKDGVIVIKAQEHACQRQNKAAAVNRLIECIRRVTATPNKRKATRPSRSSQRKRLDGKAQHGQKKALRGKIFC